MRAVCIHGHFYQPPRENPWLGTIEVQPSAAPFPDWNHRVAAECYQPNCAAPILDEQGDVADRINTYEHISFNFGATLLRWFEQHTPEVIDALIEGDRRSAERNGGHGNAMAQGYHHVIMPLASERDRRTEIRWGLADFEHRFERPAEGLWLPETAASVATLESLAAEGLRFVLLAPEQAARVRPLGSAEWTEVNASTVDTGQPYTVQLPSGQSIIAFFYNAEPSQGIAFGGWLHNGEDMAKRMSAHASGLYHMATDGESYGHHHKQGEMGLAYCIKTLLEDDTVQMTNYGAYLDANPPTHQAEIVDPSSWSCAHGVGRWSENCGCVMDPRRAGQQAWRRDLRDALNRLRDKLDAFYESKAQAFGDPWALRDAYIYDRLAVEARGTPSTLGPVAQRAAAGQDTPTLLGLLELQRHRLMMFTSCGWFFDDPAGLETVQILRYAYRAIEFQRELGGPDLEPGFVADLAAMRSADVNAPTGGAIYTNKVATAKPAAIPPVF